jgi:bla regulator protein blaR1
MNRLLDFIGGEFIYALGWTLIHSIWQVGLIAVIVALIMMRVEVKKSATRYAIFMGALLAVPILSIVTFYRLYSGIEATAVTSASLRAENPYLNEAITTVSSNLVNPGMWEMIMNVLRPGPENLQYVVLVWFAGVLMLSIRFMGGVWAINRLRGSATTDISADWKQRMAGLSESLGIRRFVQLAESARVTVPMTAGWLKPIILLPIGMLTNMPPTHIEMILLHELSHIRRHDYLMNVVQGIVEIMFFFHPAIWWLSDGVRTEREHCCDDRVLSLKSDPMAYAKALHAAAAAITSKGALAGSITPKTGLALTGENGELLERIHRILNKEMKNTIYSTRFTASTVMVVGFCLFLMLAPSSTKDDASTSVLPLADNASTWAPAKSALDLSSLAVGQSSPAITDSIPPKNREITIVKNTRGVVTELYVNGKLVPASDYSKYEEEIKRANGIIPTAPKPPVPPSSLGTTIPPISPIPPMVDSLRWAQFAESMADLATRGAVAFGTTDQAALERRMEENARNMERWAVEYEKNVSLWSKELEQNMERWAREYEKNASLWAQEFEKNMESFGKSMEAFGTKMEAWGKRMAEMETEIRQELVRDGIIQSTNEDINLKMTKEGMYVDGRKMSDKLTDKYRGIIRKYNKGDYSLKDLEYNLQINN